jgi:hypothetical protein
MPSGGLSGSSRASSRNNEGTSDGLREQPATSCYCLAADIGTAQFRKYHNDRMVRSFRTWQATSGVRRIYRTRTVTSARAAKAS